MEIDLTDLFSLSSLYHKAYISHRDSRLPHSVPKSLVLVEQENLYSGKDSKRNNYFPIFPITGNITRMFGKQTKKLHNQKSGFM